jgi:rare lipoprotein A (peptidoglycan hydrolase)
MDWIIAIAAIFGRFDDGDAGIASWYQGYYSKGEQTYYGATGQFRNFHDKPYQILVENIANGKKIVIWVRDRCTRCRTDGTGNRIIDLSPEVFSYLSNGKLWKGLLKVRINWYERNHYLFSSSLSGCTRLLR